MQHIAMPAPLSVSAAGCARTGISTPNTGEVTVRAEQRLVALVVGVRDQRDHAAAISSGRVVSTWTGLPSGRWKATRW